MRTRIAVVLAVTLITAPFMLAGGDPKGEPPTPSELLVAKINKVRARHDLKPLKYSLSLSRASRRWSQHLSRAGRLVHATDYRGSYDQAGEVLALGFADPVPAWLASPGHRAIILARWGRLAGAGRIDKLWTMRVASP